MKLPIKILPYQYESFWGFLRRLAVANHYPSPKWITDLEPCFRKNWLLTPKGDRIEAMERLLAPTPSESKFIEDWMPDKTTLYHSNISSECTFGRIRICPECLREKGYHDKIWEKAFSSACPHHNIKLIDTCPKCSTTLTWDRVNIRYCKCGVDLTRIESVPAPHPLLYYNSLIWNSMGRSVPLISVSGIPSSLLEGFNNNDLMDCFRLIYAEVTNTSFYTHNSSVAEAEKTFDNIHTLLGNWPLQFFKHLETYKKRKHPFIYRGLRDAFSPLYGYLYGEDSGTGWPVFMAEAFERYIAENWTGVIDARHRKINERVSCRYKPLANVVAKLHVGGNRMNQLIDGGIIPAIRQTMRSGRKFTVLKDCDVTRFARLAKNMLNKIETCQLLGITKHQFDELVEHRLIVPLLKPGDHGFSEWWCDKRKIDRFLKQIRSKIPAIMPKEGTIPFVRVCQAHLTHRDLLPALLRSIIDESLQVAGIDLEQTDGVFRLSSMYFNKSDIDKFRHEAVRQQEAAFTIREAAEMMGIKQEVVYHLVNSELLEAYIDPEWPKRGRQVTLATMQSFEDRFVPLKEIAQKRNACSRTVMIMLSKKGIKPAIGSGVDGCRQVFYLREDVLGDK